ncbi:hypothetical protein D3C72_1948150 [compost metagenome]
MAAPSAGLAVIAEYPSEPPHSRPIFRWLAGTGLRRAALACGSSASVARMPASIVARVPPVSCITSVRTRASSARCCDSINEATWLRSQPSPTISTAARLGWRA